MRRSTTSLLATVVALALTVVFALPASAAQWRFETLDGQTNGTSGSLQAFSGYYSSTVVWNGQPHVFYSTIESPTDDLRHAWWTGTQWQFETLDGDGGAAGRLNASMGGQTISAVVWAGTPHVFYHDASNGDLRHGWWTGTAWFFETLDGQANGPNGRIGGSVGAYASSVVWNDQPHVFYFDAQSGDMRHAWWNGSAWFFETLDGNGGTDGRINGVTVSFIATVWSGQPHVFYSSFPGEPDFDGNLRHAWWTGTKWQFETLDGTCTPTQCLLTGRINADLGRQASVVTWSRAPHVFYYDTSGGNLRHAWWTGTRWAYETLDGAGGTNGRLNNDQGGFSAAAVWGGQPHVFYLDNTTRDQRHAWWTGTTWQFETLDGAANQPDGRINAEVAIFGSSVTVWNNQPHVFYHDATNANLRHAWYG